MTHTFTCSICHQEKAPDDIFPAKLIIPSITAVVKLHDPEWSLKSYICTKDLNDFRLKYLQVEVQKAHQDHRNLPSHLHAPLTTASASNHPESLLESPTFGERMSDHLARFGGSWRFIGIFAMIMGTWIIVNSIALWQSHFDPFPYILLNLGLSCLAAIQAPIIMMSQNRQEKKDRLRAENDYLINLKAELEIRELHDKIDVLILNQWQSGLVIQEVQSEILKRVLHDESPK